MFNTAHLLRQAWQSKGWMARMLVLEAAQNSGLQQITFSAQARTQTSTLP